MAALFFGGNIFPALRNEEKNGRTKGGNDGERIYGLAKHKRQAGKFLRIYFRK